MKNRKMIILSWGVSVVIFIVALMILLFKVFNGVDSVPDIKRLLYFFTVAGVIVGLGWFLVFKDSIK